MDALTVDFRKHSGPTPADDMAAQIITDCGNFTLDFKQHWFCSSPLFLQTLGPWFPNEMQNVLSTEKRTLDHWATVQLFFSLVQVRCFWRCFCFRSGLVALSWRFLSVLTLDALTPASVHSLWNSPKCGFKEQEIPTIYTVRMVMYSNILRYWILIFISCICNHLN